MKDLIETFQAIESDVIVAIVERAKELAARGEEIHMIGVRRWGDDDDDFSFSVLVDPVLNGADQSYEARDLDLWVSEDGPEDLQVIFGTLGKMHEDEEIEQFPCGSMSEPHAVFTSMVDSVAKKLASKLNVSISLLDTEAVPFDDRIERDELRDWIKARFS